MAQRPLATPGRVEGAGPHRRFCGGWVKPGLLSVSLGVGARCAVVAAGQPAPTDWALVFAQVSSRWAAAYRTKSCWKHDRRRRCGLPSVVGWLRALAAPHP